VLCRIFEIPKNHVNEFQLRPEINSEGYLATITHLPAGRLFNRLFEFLSSETGETVGWENLENLEFLTGDTSTTDLDLMKINNFEMDFPTFESLGDSVDSYLLAFLNSIADTYIGALDFLPRRESNMYVFTGGLITQSQILQTIFSSKLPKKSNITLIKSDSSIAGLRKIVEH
jgi:hypothetical protein